MSRKWIPTQQPVYAIVAHNVRVQLDDRRVEVGLQLQFDVEPVEVGEDGYDGGLGEDELVESAVELGDELSVGQAAKVVGPAGQGTVQVAHQILGESGG